MERTNKYMLYLAEWIQQIIRCDGETILRYSPERSFGKSYTAVEG